MPCLWGGVTPKRELRRGLRAAKQHLRRQTASKRYESANAEAEKTLRKVRQRKKKFAIHTLLFNIQLESIAAFEPKRRQVKTLQQV
jgi:hypothetical protein